VCGLNNVNSVKIALMR